MTRLTGWNYFPISSESRIKLREGRNGPSKKRPQRPGQLLRPLTAGGQPEEEGPLSEGISVKSPLRGGIAQLVIVGIAEADMVTFCMMLRRSAHLD